MISFLGLMEGFRITKFTILITIQEVDGSAAKNTLSGVTLTQSRHPVLLRYVKRLKSSSDAWMHDETFDAHPHVSFCAPYTSRDSVGRLEGAWDRWRERGALSTAYTLSADRAHCLWRQERWEPRAHCAHCLRLLQRAVGVHLRDTLWYWNVHYSDTARVIAKTFLNCIQFRNWEKMPLGHGQHIFVIWQQTKILDFLGFLVKIPLILL